MRPCWLLCLLLVTAPGLALGAEQPLTHLLRQETATLTTLESLASWIEQATQKLESARTAAGQLDYELAEATRRSEALSQRLQRRRRHLKRRLRALYKMSRGGVVRLLLEAANAQDLSLRLSGASRVLGRDLQELKLYRSELAQLEQEKRELQKTKQRQRALQQELERDQQKFLHARQKQRELLDKLRSSRRAKQRLARDLSRYQRKLLARIAASDGRLAQTTGLSQLRGNLRPPVQGAVVGRFGQITDKSKLEILRTGLTFATSKQRPVRAVAPGTVRLAGPLEGYGQLVLLDHGEGYFTLYAFLSRLEATQGKKIKAGDTIGQSGLDPLTAKPALYFELRRGKQPLDPWPWLRH